MTRDSGSYTLEIAGRGFRVESDTPSSQPFSASYVPFIGDGDGIPVRCSRGVAPVLAGSPTIDGGPWSMYPTSDGPCFVGPSGVPHGRCAMLWRPDTHGFDLTLSNPMDGPATIPPAFVYPFDFLATLLTLDDGVVLHASAAIIDGEAHVFIAPSGVGKSTVARKLADRSTVLSDERIVIRRTEDGWRAWGTPWASSQGAAVNASAPVAGLYSLSQAKTVQRTRLSPEALRARLFSCTSVPLFHPPAMDGHLSALTQLCHSVPGFLLALTLDCPIFEIVRGG